MSRKDNDINQINLLYDECINYLKSVRHAHEVLAMDVKQNIDFDEHYREMLENIQLKDIKANKEDNSDNNVPDDDSIDESATESDSRIDVAEMKTDYEVVNELKPIQDGEDGKSQRLRKLSATLPKIIITNSNTSLHTNHVEEIKSKSTNDLENHKPLRKNSAVKQRRVANSGRPMCHRLRGGYAAWYPKRLVSKSGLENVALISNVPYEKIRLLNDTFHTLINLRWRWIVSGTIVVHFAIWLVFAVCWYVAALAHYDFEPDPPQRACVTGGHDFTTIFLASVEAQTTIGFGDRTIDEECPESIFLFIMQLIMGTGLSGVLTCVVYAKLTRPEKLSRDGVGFSKKAVISMRDGKLCLMLRAWDLNYDHIISSEFCAHFVKTHRTKEGEVIRYYARSLELSQRQFLLWPVTLVHVIDEQSPLYDMTPQQFANSNYEITVSLKGASASMGTFTQSQTSYLPREVAWGFRLPSVVKYDSRQQKYVIEHKKLDEIEVVDTPMCSARQLHHSTIEKSDSPPAPPMSPTTPAAPSPSSFSERVSSFRLERTSSFRRRAEKAERTDKIERPEGNSQALVPWTANGHVQLRKLAQ